MSRVLRVRPLTRNSFAPFGDVLDTDGSPDRIINQGRCGRYHDRAGLEWGSGRLGISLFDAAPRELPLELDMVERHPDGSQAFIPMHQNPWLVIVAADEDGTPGIPQVFMAEPGQGVNYHRNVWHGVLSPLRAPGLFAVVDRIGEGPNLEEHWFETPYLIEAG